MSSPTQRSLSLLRERGYTADITERFLPYARKRKDLFGFIDIAGLHPHHTGVLGVQTTTGGNLSARIIKAKKLKSFWLWIGCGNVVEFHGWRKLKGVWVPRVVMECSEI